MQSDEKTIVHVHNDGWTMRWLIPVFMAVLSTLLFTLFFQLRDVHKEVQLVRSYVSDFKNLGRLEENVQKRLQTNNMHLQSTDSPASRCFYHIRKVGLRSGIASGSGLDSGSIFIPCRAIKTSLEERTGRGSDEET